MGRLHVSKTWTDRALAEMDIREEGDHRWSTWAYRLRLLSGVSMTLHWDLAKWPPFLRAHHLDLGVDREGRFRRVTGQSAKSERQTAHEA